MSLTTLFSGIKARFFRPFCQLDLVFVSAFICAAIAYLASDRTINIVDGGYRVALIRFSLFLLLFLVNNALWIVLTAMHQLLFKERRLGWGNMLLFLISHVIGLHIIASDAIHYAMFKEHWNWTALLTAVDGIKHGMAPMNMSVAEMFMNVVIISLALFVLALLLKCINPLGRSMRADNGLLLGGALGFSLCLMIAVQQMIPGNWHSRQLQQGVPWIQFVQKLKPYPIADASLLQMGDIKLQQQKLIGDIQQRVQQLPEHISAKRRPNILLVHVEALRWDMFNGENMPRLYDFVQRHANKGALSLPKHYSSSNNTVGSMFGLVSGLTGPLYQHFRETPFTPPSIALLRAAGYQFSIFNSVVNTYQDAEKLLFSGFIKHDFLDGGIVEREQVMIDRFLDVSSAESVKPRLDYLVINSTHFPYSYPENHRRFTPVVELDGMAMKASSMQYLANNKPQVKRRFMNAVSYADHLLGDLLQGLEQAQALDNTVVVIVGDHGQEFWEHNRFSHSWSFVDEQAQVVAVMKFPEAFINHYRYSSHSDVMPSILDYMGLDVELSELMNGKSLLRYRSERDFASIGISVIDSQKPSQEAVVGEQIKVEYTIAPELLIDAVKTDSDDAIDFNQNEAVIYGLIRRSIYSSASSYRL